MAYCFRLKFALSTCLNIESVSVRLSPVGQASNVELRAAGKDAAIKDTRDLVLKGDGFASAEEATRAGNQYRDALSFVFCQLRVGANLTGRAVPHVVPGLSNCVRADLK